MTEVALNPKAVMFTPVASILQAEIWNRDQQIQDLQTLYYASLLEIAEKDKKIDDLKKCIAIPSRRRRHLRHHQKH